MPTDARPDDRAITAALRGVIDPELGDNVVELGMYKGFDWLDDDGWIDVRLALTTAGCPLRAQLMKDVKDRIGALPGVREVKVTFGEMTTQQKSQLMARARWKARAEGELATDIPATARVVAIASGKGGVGKSSVTANLAVALAQRGLTVGVLDADIGGFSIPRMLGLTGQVEAEAKRMVPLEKKVGAGLLKVISMGVVGGTEEDQALMWRGLILNRAVQHFLEDVRWGDLDYLLIDMPPGTADIQMGLARMLPRTEMLIVTTPAVAAQKVAARAADMARKGYLRVAGVIENMSAFTCEHGETYAVFGSGGGERLSADIGVSLLGSIPLDPAVAAGGDAGVPALLAEPDGAVAAAVTAIADRILTEAIPLVEMDSCSARLFEKVEQALGPKQA